MTRGRPRIEDRCGDLHLRQANTYDPALLRERPVAVSAPTRRSTPETPATWPVRVRHADGPGLHNYDSGDISGRLPCRTTGASPTRSALNLGLRYDLDTNLRDEDVYAQASCKDPQPTRASRISSAPTAATTTNNLQPRLGVTYDMRGDATLVMRGGYGFYVTRNRPWFQLFSMNSFLGNSVTIQDPQLLQFYPDINAVLGGKTLDDYIAAGGARSVFAIPDDSVLPDILECDVGGWVAAELSDHARRGLRARCRRSPARRARPEPAGVGCDRTEQSAPGQRLYIRDVDAELHQNLVRRSGDAVAHQVPRQRGQHTDLIHAIAQLPRRRELLWHVAGHAAYAARARVQMTPISATT